MNPDQGRRTHSHFGGFLGILHRSKSKSTEQIDAAHLGLKLSKRASSFRDLSYSAGLESEPLISSSFAEIDEQPNKNKSRNNSCKENTVPLSAKLSAGKKKQAMSGSTGSPSPVPRTTPATGDTDLLDQTLNDVRVKLAEMSAERIEMESRIGEVEDEIESIYFQVCNKRPYCNYPLQSHNSAFVSPTNSTTSLPNYQQSHSRRQRRGTAILNHPNLNHKTPDDSVFAHSTSQDSPQHRIINHHRIPISTPPSSPKARMFLQTVQKQQYSSSTDNFNTSTSSHHRSSLQETSIPNTIYETQEDQHTLGDNHSRISTPQRKMTPVTPFSIHRRSSLNDINSNHSHKPHLLTRKTSCVNDFSPSQESSFNTSNTEQKHGWFEDV